MAHKVHYGRNLPIVYRLIGPGAHKSAWKVKNSSLTEYSIEVYIIYVSLPLHLSYF